MRRIGSLIILLAILALWLWIERRDEAARTIRAADGAAVRVIDGDSLRIGEEEIRIAGIDAPEYRQACGDGRGGEWPCGRAARDALERLVRAGDLACVERARDRYGRRLADCRTRDGDIGAAMMRAGLALDARDPRFRRFDAEAEAARRAGRGLWRGPHRHPAEWRAAQGRGASG